MKKTPAFLLTVAALTLASCAQEQVQNANAQSANAENANAENANAQNAKPPVAAAPNAKKPNVILIVSDDQGYADLGFQGSKEIATPNLDLLAASGVICTAGYVTFPVCSPSRAGFVSGRHGARMGYDTNADGDTRTNPAIGLPGQASCFPSSVASSLCASDVPFLTTNKQRIKFSSNNNFPLKFLTTTCNDSINAPPLFKFVLRVFVATA